LNRIGIDNAKGAVSTRLNPVVPTLKTRSAGEALRFLTEIEASTSTATAPTTKEQLSSLSPSLSGVDGINLNTSLVNTTSLMVYDMKSNDLNESFKRHLPVKLSDQTPGKILAARRKEHYLQKIKLENSTSHNVDL